MVQVAKSKLAAKYGSKLDAAVKAHADEPIVERGFRNAPPGINNGRIQIIECFFEEQGKDTKAQNVHGKPAVGEFIFRTTGVIQDDYDNDDSIPTKGIQVRIGNGFGISVFDTKKGDGTISTLDEKVAEILNYFKMWGLDVSGAGGGELEGLAETIQEAKPYTGFGTTLGKPKTDGSRRVWENWGKNDPDYSPPDASDVQDDTSTAEPAKAPQTKPTASKTVSKPATKAAPEPEPEPEVPFGDDLDDLAVDCNSEDEDTAADATQKMAKRAKACGVDHEDEQYADWAAVAQAIREAEGGSAGEEVDFEALGTAAEAGDQEAADKLDELRQAAGMSDEEYGNTGWEALATWLSENSGGEEAGSAIEVGNVYGYKLAGATKPTDCEVVTLEDDKVTLKNLTTGKVILNKMKKPLLVDVSELIAD